MYLWEGENDGEWMYSPPSKDEDIKEDWLKEDEWLYSPPSKDEDIKEEGEHAHTTHCVPPHSFDITRSVKYTLLRLARKYNLR